MSTPHPRAWLTVAEIAAGTGWTTGSIYRLASADRWRRRDRHNPARYAADDVLATIARRALAETMARQLDAVTSGEDTAGQGVITAPDNQPPDTSADT